MKGVVQRDSERQKLLIPLVRLYMLLIWTEKYRIRSCPWPDYTSMSSISTCSHLQSDHLTPPNASCRYLNFIYIGGISVFHHSQVV